MRKITILLLVSIGAFAADAPPVQPGKVRVYLYRPGYGIVNIYFDGSHVARFKWPKENRFYQVVDVEPGRHFIHANTDSKRGISVNLTLDREYYVACHDDSVAFVPKHPCSLIDPEQGKSDIEKLTFREGSK